MAMKSVSWNCACIGPIMANLVTYVVVVLRHWVYSYVRQTTHAHDITATCILKYSFDLRHENEIAIYGRSHSYRTCSVIVAVDYLQTATVNKPWKLCFFTYLQANSSHNYVYIVSTCKVGVYDNEVWRFLPRQKPTIVKFAWKYPILRYHYLYINMYFTTHLV